MKPSKSRRDTAEGGAQAPPKKKKPEWQPKGSVSPAPNATRAKGDGLVDRVKAEKANRERKSSSKKPQKSRSSKDRDVDMDDDGDELFFVGDVDLTTRTTSPMSSTSLVRSWTRSSTSSSTDCLRCFVRPIYRRSMSF